MLGFFFSWLAVAKSGVSSSEEIICELKKEEMEGPVSVDELCEKGACCGSC